MALASAVLTSSTQDFKTIPFSLSSPARLRAAARPKGLTRRILIDATINALRRKDPDLSAATPLASWQRLAPFFAVAAISWLIATWTEAATHVFAVSIAVPFLLVVILRLSALVTLAALSLRASAKRRRRANRVAHPKRLLPRDDDALPTYSILVALYREAAAAPGLVRALAALDYPRAKLEIIFLIEEDDFATRSALSRAIQLPHMRIVIVPHGLPRTKPRALTYGLQAASGELIGVFDAEDVPERSQLRRAAAAFAQGDDGLACVQARLGLYNPRESWISRQFTIEYAALFEALLPMFEKAGFVIPLSGTSNHFRRECLVRVGGWDPYNLTEDADLGLRFARSGYRVSLIDAITWEEAPATWRVWLGQRTRWIKGWMQTYLVHMRRPVRLWRDIGWWRFMGVQLTFGALVLSALVHPYFYIVIALKVLRTEPVFSQSEPVWLAAFAVLMGGYVSGIALPAMAIARRRGRSLIISAFWHPVYWLAISVAAHRAVFDLVTRPYYWEKTPHRGVDVTRRQRRA